MKINDIFDKLEESDKFRDSQKLFSIRKNDSDQYHVFYDCKKTADRKCRCAPQSACDKMARIEGTPHRVCITDREARSACLELARQACGTCVSTLYGDFPDF